MLLFTTWLRAKFDLTHDRALFARFYASQGWIAFAWGRTNEYIYIDVLQQSMI